MVINNTYCYYYAMKKFIEALMHDIQNTLLLYSHTKTQTI